MIGQVFEDIATGLETGSLGGRVKVGLTLLGSELGEAELLRGAELAQAEDPSIEVVVIGTPPTPTALTHIEAPDEEAAHKKMDELLQSGELAVAVTLHYSFPIGVSTVGRVLTPALGRKVYIANTTGTSDTDRVAAMLKNVIAGIATAKACGNPSPTVGLLNLDGARGVERALKKLQDGGYELHFSESARADGGAVMRGNDLLQGVADVMVMDSLTGNVMIKMLSAYQSGGSYEAIGDGYGPGVGAGYDRIIGIISRASGAPVIAGAIRYMAACARGDLLEKVRTEFEAAKRAGLDAILASLAEANKPAPGDAAPSVPPPPEKVVTEEIPGIEILVLEDAVQVLWQKSIYATSGMGCTGPIVLVAPDDLDAALQILKETEFL